MTDEFEDPDHYPSQSRIKRIVGTDTSDIKPGSLPTIYQMIKHENIFWSKCQLDQNGNRTNIPRVKPSGGYMEGQRLMWNTNKGKKKK